MADAPDGRDDAFEKLEHDFFAAGEALEPEAAVTAEELSAWVGAAPAPLSAHAGPLPAPVRALRFLKVAVLWGLCLAPWTARRLARAALGAGRGLVRALFFAGDRLAALVRAVWRAFQATAVRRLSPRRLAAMIRRGEWLPMPWLPLALERPWLAIAALALLISTVGSVWAAAVLAATGLGHR
jgi:hypothetical protein